MNEQINGEKPQNGYVSLDTPVEDSGFSDNLSLILLRANICDLRTLVCCSEEDLLLRRGIGQKLLIL